MKKIIIAAILSTLLLGAVAVPADAARGGHRHAALTAGISLSVSPDPVAANGGVYEIAGAGFPAGMIVQLFVYGLPNEVVFVGQVPADSTGAFSGVSGITGGAGTYRVDAIDPADLTQTVIATVNFTVQ